MKKILSISVVLVVIIVGVYFVTENKKNLISPDEYWAQGIIQGQRGNPDKAIEIYEQGLKIDSKNAKLTCAVGFAYEDKYFKNPQSGGNYLTKAISYYEKGVNFDLNSVYCRGYLAEAYFYASNYINSWKQVNILIKQGYNPPSGFITNLSNKMPNPEK